jgi:hypothetical protein
LSEEKRIYVVVAQTVDTPNGVIIQPCGRAIAQACHAIGKMQVTSRIYHARDVQGIGGRLDFEDMPFEEYTTIVLAARDSKELEHVNFLLATKGIPRHMFADNNDAVYGEHARICTALATVPVSPISIYGVLDYLPLWGHSHAD